VNNVKSEVNLETEVRHGLRELAVRLLYLSSALVVHVQYVENSLWLYISTTSLFGKLSMKHRKTILYDSKKY
jgi:hypothetical protein